MLHLYRKLLQLRQTVLTATGDTSADLLDMGDTVVAYSRPATEGRRFLSVTNFGGRHRQFRAVDGRRQAG